MPWKSSSVMEERLCFVARVLEGEAMTDVCREFGISRKTGYKIFYRYREHGLEALTDRSRRPVPISFRSSSKASSSTPSATSRIGAPAKSAISWSAGWQATSGFPPKVPSMPCSTGTAWSSVQAGNAIAPPELPSQQAACPMTCGARTTRANSVSVIEPGAIR